MCVCGCDFMCLYKQDIQPIYNIYRLYIILAYWKFSLYWWRQMLRRTAPEDHLPGNLSQSQQLKQALYLQGLIKLIELACCGF